MSINCLTKINLQMEYNLYREEVCQLTDVKGREYKIVDQISDQYLTTRQFITLLVSDRNFCKFYNTLLSQCEFDAFYWEHPVISSATLDDDYRFSLIESRSLNIANADPTPFREKFSSTSRIVVFDNLGKDATLIVPNATVYRDHDLVSLANVVRELEMDSQIELWQTVGNALQKAIERRKVFLNTAGNGVYWCHVRLDSRPKYYKNYRYKEQVRPTSRPPSTGAEWR